MDAGVWQALSTAISIRRTSRSYTAIADLGSLIETNILGNPTDSIIQHHDLHHICLCPKPKNAIGINGWQETRAQPMVVQEEFSTFVNNNGKLLKNPFSQPEEPDYEWSSCGTR